jgi:hypothetical protein
MRNLFVRFGVLVLLLTVFTAASHAQDNAALTGVVTDASGAVVPGTVVTLTNPSIGISVVQKTDSTGTYRFANVPPNTGYVISFAHDGFTAYTVNKLALSVGVTKTQNAKLQVGANQTVEVSANNQLETLNTTDATIGNNFDVQLINNLPIQSRDDVGSLFTLQPGVASGSFAGARTDQNSVTVDGMDTNDIASGANLTVVGHAPVDSIQEFRGTVAGLTSGEGTGSGGQFQLVTKSGTNRFHGQLDEYHRDTATVANTYFNKNVSPVIGRPSQIQNQFGGSLGGPIKKDKLFFFFDFNNNRFIQTASQSRTIPTASFLAGNLSYINTNAGCNSASRSNTQPTCISTLTSAQVQALDPQHIGFSAPLLQLLNARYGALSGGSIDPTLGDGVNTIGYRFNYKEPTYEYNYVARFDYNLTAHQRLFVRGTISHNDSIQSAVEFPNDPLTSPFIDRSYGYVVSHVWEIGSKKVNQFYYGDTISEYNFANNFNPAGTTELSTTKYIAGFASGPYAGQSSQKRRVPIPEIRDDFNWQLGRHNVTFGGTFKFIKTNSQLVNDFNFVSVGLSPYTALSRAQAPANANFGGTTAIYDYFGAFNVALGSIAEVDSNYNYNTAGVATPQGGGTSRHYRYYQTELYVGDTWKVTPRLTFDYGLRYQLYSVPYETTGLQSVQQLSYQAYLNARVAQSNSGNVSNTGVPLSTFVLGGKANNGPNAYNPSYKDFAPRVAFSYNPTPKTVINGSAGIVYDRTVINAVDFIQDQNSQLFQQTLSTPYTRGYSNPRLGAIAPGSVIPTFANPNPPGTISHPYTPNVDFSGNYNGTIGYPDGLANNSFTESIDSNLKDPYSINYNVGLQQEMGNHIIMRLNYVGRLGRRLLSQVDGSQLIDFPDKISGQSMGAAVANLETQIRAGKTYQTVTPIPWFENVVGSGGSYNGPAYGFANNTSFATYYFGSLLQKGDFADFIQGLAAYGTLPANVGLASQFAGNTYVTNGGFSSYNGLLLSVSKNLSQGLQADFNYTFSHSIDNTSQVANSISAGSGYGFLCDVIRPRECRANSDFDVQNIVNADFVYQLPVGRGRQFATNIPTWAQEVIGGWNVAAIPSWRSGFALTTATSSYVAGYANNAPALFNGNRGDVIISPHKVGSTVLGFTNCPAVGGCAAFNDFSYPTGFTIGSRNALRSPSAFGMNAGLSKDFLLLPNDRLTLKFRADFFNVLNHTVFGAPATDISSASTFGVISSTVAASSGSNTGGARIGQYSLRLEF